jgi:AraC-like DNA-binding protein
VWLTRPPPAALRPFVRFLWLVDERDRPRAPGARERVLPSGTFDLVILLREAPIRLFASPEDLVGHVVGHGALTANPAAPWLRDTSEPSRTAGVHFRPGGAAALLGIAAPELVPRYTPLTDLWGQRGDSLRDALCSARTPEDCLERLERALLELASRAHEPHPAVRGALRLFARHPQVPVGQVVEASGLSYARFLQQFREEVGHTPKTWCRILRFHRLIAHVARTPEPDWGSLAHAMGFSDQPHLVREFRTFSGTTPSRYAPIDPTRPNHLPVSP